VRSRGRPQPPRGPRSRLGVGGGQTRPGAHSRPPALFAKCPVVLDHGDFAPIDILPDGASVTGLLDFESVHLADPLFDVAWWA
jgi:hypothetical protein